MAMIPRGPISIPVESLRSKIAATEEFIARCALDGVTADEQAFVHARRPEKEGNVIRPTAMTYPFVIVRPSPTSWTVAWTDCYTSEMTLRVLISDKFRQENFSDGIVDFNNFIGVMFDQLMTDETGGARIRQVVLGIAEPVPRKDLQSDLFAFIDIEADVNIGLSP